MRAQTLLRQTKDSKPAVNALAAVLLSAAEHISKSRTEKDTSDFLATRYAGRMVRNANRPVTKFNSPFS